MTEVIVAKPETIDSALVFSIYLGRKERRMNTREEVETVWHRLQVILFGWKSTTMHPATTHQRLISTTVNAETTSDLDGYSRWKPGLRLGLALFFVPSIVSCGFARDQRRKQRITSCVHTLGDIITGKNHVASDGRMKPWSLYLFLLLRSHKNMPYQGHLVAGCSSHGPPNHNPPCWFSLQHRKQ